MHSTIDQPFIECTPAREGKGENEAEWLLFFEGAVSSLRSGAKIVLISLEGEALEHSLQFTFPTSNNVDKYETLIAKMSLARELEVTH